MKNIFSLAIFTLSLVAHAGPRKPASTGLGGVDVGDGTTSTVLKSLSESSSKIDLALVSNVTPLEKMYDPHQGPTIINLVTLDISGNTTGVAPSAKHFITFHRTAESSVRRSVFEIGNSWGLKSVQMLSRGVYQIAVQQMNENTGEMKIQTVKVDISPLLKDDQKMPYSEFEDKYMNSSIQVILNL